MVLCTWKATKLICCTAQLPTAGCKRPVVMQWHFKLRKRETLCLVSAVYLNVITSSYKAGQWFKAYCLLNFIKIIHRTRITTRCITANKNYVQFNSSIKKYENALSRPPFPPGSIVCTGLGVQRVLLCPQRFLWLLLLLAATHLQQKYKYNQKHAHYDGYKNPQPCVWHAFCPYAGFKISWKRKRDTLPLCTHACFDMIATDIGWGQKKKKSTKPRVCFTFCIEVNSKISGPFHCNLPPTLWQRWNPLLHLAEIHSTIFKARLQDCEIELFGQRVTESQLITPPKHLQSGVPVGSKYGLLFGFCIFLEEPCHLELRLHAGLLGDLTGDGEILGPADIQLHFLLWNGQVLTCKKHTGATEGLFTLVRLCGADLGWDLINRKKESKQHNTFMTALVLHTNGMQNV